MNEATELTELAYENGHMPLTATPVIGAPNRSYPQLFEPGTEELDAAEIRVTVLGSGDPFVRRSQAAASILVEIGNEERDFLLFDLGSGAVANFNSLGLPVTAATKVFLSHLHADHVGDFPTFLWCLAKGGRRDPVEVWGPAGEYEPLGTRAFTEHLAAAYAWDTESLAGDPRQSGVRTLTTEVPYDTPAVVYERNGVTVTSFPVVHVLNGAVGYRVDFAGLSVVFSGDTRPCRTLVDAASDADLLIHETFPAAPTFAAKAGIPLETASHIIAAAHTSPRMAGKVFNHVGARMSAFWHLALDHETVGPVFQEMRQEYDGPVTASQDFTVFDITKEAVVTRQAKPNPMPWPVVGPSHSTARPGTPHPPPAWWNDVLMS
jgi:ribonuclease Z